MLSPLLLLYTLWRAYKDGGKHYLKQRLGIYQQTHTTSSAPTRIWIHAASVGEVFTLLPLLKALDTPLLVTTMSPTGATVLHKQALQHVTHQYLPIDFPGACRRFLQQANITQGWIVETEIWPWLFSCARQQQIPLTIINARLSNKTSQQHDGFMASTFRHALQDVRILARSQDDANRYAQLGANPDSITTVGNLKYAHTQTSDNNKVQGSPIAQPYILAASTHANEEEHLALAWQQMQPNLPLMVIVPRHPERGLSIQKQLARHNIHAALRSEQHTLSEDAQFYIADTLGELDSWYASASACFIGGSLIERGGHNVLEAARLNCPIVVGPHTFNFTDIIDSMMKEDSLVVVEDAQAAAKSLCKIAKNRSDYNAMVQRAKHQASKSDSILTDYLALLI